MSRDTASRVRRLHRDLHVLGAGGPVGAADRQALVDLALGEPEPARRAHCPDPEIDALSDEAIGDELRMLTARLQRLGLDELFAGATVTDRPDTPEPESVVDAMLAPLLRAGRLRLVKARRAEAQAEHDVTLAAREVDEARRALARAELAARLSAERLAKTRAAERDASRYTAVHASDRAELLPVVAEALAGTHLKWAWRGGRIVDKRDRPLLPLSRRFL